MPRKTDKRARLIDAALILIHQQGFNITTLADIAEKAGVPLGNVYYYFKTKLAIGIAVIEKRSQELSEKFQSLNENQQPKEKLKAMLDFAEEDLELIARYGCPIGGLCQELGKQGGALADLAAKLLNDEISWVSEQFKAMGVTSAIENANSFVARIQGAHLLTHTFKDPSLSKKEAQELKTWLDKVTENSTEKAAVSSIF